MKWSDIPLGFSNVIGQLLPGAVILILAFATVAGPTSAFTLLIKPDIQQRIFSWGFSGAFLIAAYATGMIFGHLWVSTIGKTLKRHEDQIIRSQMEERLNEHRKTLADLELSGPELHAGRLPEPFVMCDHLHLCVPEQAFRMVKVRAEMRYCRTVAGGAIILALVVDPWRAYADQQYFERTILGACLLLIAYASLEGAERLLKFWTNGTTATWLTVASSKRLPFQANPSETDE